MKIHYKFILFLAVVLLCLAMKPVWGFYGHKRINRLAVFTLPAELIGFYKQNIDFITDHAVDPDKRRYASKHEAVRHYIDLDHWGEAPFPEVPKTWLEAISKYTSIYVVNTKGDTTELIGNELVTEEDGVLKVSTGIEIEKQKYLDFVRLNVLPIYYEDEWIIDCDSVAQLLGNSSFDWNCQTVFAEEYFTEFGIVPYHLVKMQRRLTDAFKSKSTLSILRLSTEFGHYIGDAHVPLHTSENYNGQMTGQDGLHGFWESRLPELFADDTYDFFVGKAEYIDNPETYYWDVVLKSHEYVDSIFAIEKELSRIYPQDQQYCFEERNGRTIKQPCRDYAAAFHERLAGQVEARFRGAIHTVGSAWYTAWVDAGQPDFEKYTRLLMTDKDKKEQKALENIFKAGKILGRDHGQ